MAVTSAPISTAPSFGRSGWRDLDWSLLLLVLLLSAWSCFTIFSATRPSDNAFAARVETTRDVGGAASGMTSNAPDGASTTTAPRARLSDVSKQLLWIALGLIAIALMTTLDYQLLMHLQFWLYTGSLGLLGLLLMLPRSIAPVINGAKSWIVLGPIGSLQPAEFTKFATIVTLAAFLCRRQERIRELPTVGWSLLYLAPPLLLILKQPDFGTMLAVLSIWFGMLFFGGARGWHLLLVAAVGLSLFGAAWKMNVLKPHQKARLAVFLETNPTKNARSEGYHIKQSQIAIGAGKISGQGWTKGCRTAPAMCPKKQPTSSSP
jgi:rod shape determining protein RodA